jgi:glycosyltransferase involved in cell wall biosynthesis
MPIARIYYSSRLSAADWSRRHAAGTVPDVMPYGLNRMEDYGVRVRSFEPYTGASSLVAGGLRRYLGGYDWLARPLPDEEIALCWDERVGIPLSLRVRGPVATGAIWVTEPSRSPHFTDGLARRALQRAAAVWSLSRAQLDRLSAWGASEPRWLPFGIDADFWSPGPRDGEGRILSVGNDRHRDHDTLIAGVGKILRDRQGDLLLVTQHPVAVPPDVGRRVTSLPHDALRAEYRKAQLVAITTVPNLHCSGITAVLEAMACGRAVIVSDTPGMRDYVRDGIDGLLVPPRDSDALAAAVADLLQDPDRCDEMGRSGRISVEERFSTQVMARELAQLALSLR